MDTGTGHEPSPEASRFRDVAELHELGVAMYRQRMWRENPQASGDEIDVMVKTWLSERPQPDIVRRSSREHRHGTP